MEGRDRLYLLHMLEAVESIEEDASFGVEEFLATPRLQRSIIRSFEVLGEAAKNVSATTRESNPEVPWSRIAGFRDVLIHAYFRIEPLEVWRVVENDLQTLRDHLERILAPGQASS